MSVWVAENVKDSGVWYVHIRHPKIPNKSKRKKIKVGERVVAEKLAEVLSAKMVLKDYGALGDQESTAPTLKEYLEGWDGPDGEHIGWLVEMRLGRKNSTIYGYGQVIKNHLIPAFGDTQIDMITSSMIKKLVIDSFGKGLMTETVRNIKNCLSAILTTACDEDKLIKVNPARSVRVPRPEDERSVREPNPFSWEERTHFEACFKAKYPETYSLVMCGFRAGLRIGELLALQWQDLDFYNRTLLVRRNFTRGKITTPKSKAGNRKVRMTTKLTQTLKHHRTVVARKTLRLGWKDVPEWVWPNMKGGPLNYGNFVNRVWNRAMKKSELLRRTPHDMRHTYATLRLSMGDPLTEVAKEMGHSDPQITFRTYYKWMPQESRSDIDRLDFESDDVTPSDPYMTPNEKGLNEIQPQVIDFAGGGNQIRTGE